MSDLMEEWLRILAEAKPVIIPCAPNHEIRRELSVEEWEKAINSVDWTEGDPCDLTWDDAP